MKKTIKTLIIVIIPLLAAFLIGLYGYNYYSGGSQIKYDYYEKVEANTTSQLQAFMKYNEYKYEAEPTYKKVVYSPNNESLELFTFEIYKAAYFGTKTVNKQEVEKELSRYILVMYNVNYDEILTLFDLTPAQIKNASTPVFKFVLTPNNLEDYSLNDKVTYNLSNTSRTIDGIFGIVDYGAKPSKENPDPFTASTYTGAYYTRWNVETNYSAEFGMDFTMSIQATTTYVDDTLEILDSENNVSPLLNVDYNFKKMFTEDEIKTFSNGFNNEEKKAGYFLWVTGKYLWWICLITFVVIFGLTYTFVIVWENDDTAKTTKKTPQYKQKK